MMAELPPVASGPEGPNGHNDDQRNPGSVVQPPQPDVDTDVPDASPRRRLPLPVSVEDVPDEGREKKHGNPVPLPTPPTNAAEPQPEFVSPTNRPVEEQEASRGALTPRPSPRRVYDARNGNIHVHAPQVRPLHGAFKYLDADSPPVNQESIQRFAERGNRGSWYNNAPQPVSPSSTFSHSSVPSSQHSETFSPGVRENESYRSWSPEHHHYPGGSPTSVYPKQYPNQQFPPPPPMSNGQHWQSPGMASSAPFPSPGHSQFGGPPPPGPFPPRDNRQPLMSGYQLVAAKLSGTLSGPPVAPIYRRFEALNHRLLLYLQDELSDLESQLRDLDNADTQSRWFPGGIVPASRRKEISTSPGDAAHRKTEILGHIGWKLAQYNKVITSFRETQCLVAPSLHEINEYRAFLAQGNYISEEETRFLDETDDLASLVIYEDEEPEKSPLLLDRPPGTPMKSQAPSTLSQEPNGSSPRGPKLDNTDVRPRRAPPRAAAQARSPVFLAYAIIAAVLVPILTFAVIPGFVERMVVVVLVFSGVATGIAQSGLHKKLGDNRGMLDWALCAGLYWGLMAFVAATCS